MTVTYERVLQAVINQCACNINLGTYTLGIKKKRIKFRNICNIEMRHLLGESENRGVSRFPFKGIIHLQRGEAGLNEGLVGEYRGEAGLKDGDCGVYRGEVGEKLGDVGEYCGLVGE
jgi:hypothetical protein